MIGYLKGITTWIGDTSCMIEVNGIGYRVMIGKNTKSMITPGEPTHMFTHMQVKESEIELIGFVTEDEYILFTILIQASGIGPKIALAAIDTLGVSATARAISNKDTAMMGRVPGIGKKTAEKMCVELHDKIPDIFITHEHSPITHDIIDALIAMGYSEYHAQKVVHGLDVIESLESGLARALQALSK